MAITYGKNYGRPTLDLNFAENKSLIDSVTGRNLITEMTTLANDCNLPEEFVSIFAA